MAEDPSGRGVRGGGGRPRADEVIPVFGYIRPDRAELKIREYQVFKAHYCGLCAGLAQLGGCRARLTVSYEGAFLLLLLTSLRERPPAYRRMRCPLPPWRPVPVVVAPVEQRYAAAMNVLLAYHQMRDNAVDAGGGLAGRLRAAGAAVAARLLAGPARRAASLYPEQARAVRECLALQAAREREQCADLDLAADPFARLLAELAPGPPEWRPRPGDQPVGRSLQEGLRLLGYNLGKWVYTADAMADLEEDVAAGRYNPVAGLFADGTPAAVWCAGAAAGDEGAGAEAAARGGRAGQVRKRGPERGGQVRERMRERVGFVLTQCLVRMAEVVDLLPLESNRGLIENVVYLGLREQTERVLAGPRGGGCDERSLRGAGAETRCQRSGDQAGLPRAGEEVPS